MQKRKLYLRDEIEQAVKTLGIDRTRFYEYSKQRYESVLNRFYEEVFTLPRRQLSQITPWTKIRKIWQRVDAVGFLQHDGDWSTYLKKVRALLPCPEDCKLYLITSEDFVYEGYPAEIFSVIDEAECMMDDFYILSPKFEWFLLYCDDGDCAVLYEKGEKQ
ncbi:MAG: hypothetical protein IK130_01030 [Oscillospiraceae bacterium]|nr:hypothetical protein [Oscillospiraceae bacterium]